MRKNLKISFFTIIMLLFFNKAFSVETAKNSIKCEWDNKSDIPCIKIIKDVLADTILLHICYKQKIIFLTNWVQLMYLGLK